MELKFSPKRSAKNAEQECLVNHEQFQKFNFSWKSLIPASYWNLPVSIIKLLAGVPALRAGWGVFHTFGATWRQGHVGHDCALGTHLSDMFYTIVPLALSYMGRACPIRSCLRCSHM